MNDQNNPPVNQNQPAQTPPSDQPTWTPPAAPSHEPAQPAADQSQAPGEGSTQTTDTCTNCGGQTDKDGNCPSCGPTVPPAA